MAPKPAADSMPRKSAGIKNLPPQLHRNSLLSIRLNTTPDVAAQLRELQLKFSEVCNAIAPIVRETRCWNRVALHHLVYRNLRERFPQLGSQMICNAIYSVSRTCRAIFQAPASPFNLARLGQRPLPHIRFAAEAPVYFDRHTLSIRDGIVSMLTLDGRVRFQLSISEDDEQRFREERLREIQLVQQGGQYELRFVFASDDDASSPASAPASTTRPATSGTMKGAGTTSELPEYVVLLDESETETVKELGEVA